MSSPVQEYIDLYKRLMSRRATNPVSEIEDDKILDQIDAVWFRMTAAEHREVDDYLDEEERAKKSSDNHPGERSNHPPLK